MTHTRFAFLLLAGANLIFEEFEELISEYFTFYCQNYLIHAMPKFKISHIEFPKFYFLLIVQIFVQY